MSQNRVLANPCRGSLREACDYSCDTGYNAFGTHLCKPDGTFEGGVCAPDGTVPYTCGSSGQLRFVPEGKMSAEVKAKHKVTASMKARYMRDGPTRSPVQCTAKGN